MLEKLILILLLLVIFDKSDGFDMVIIENDIIPVKPPTLLYSFGNFDTNNSLTITNIVKNSQKTFSNITFPSFCNIISIISVSDDKIFIFANEIVNTSSYNYILIDYFIKENNFVILNSINNQSEFLNIQRGSVGYIEKTNSIYGMESNADYISIYEFNFEEEVITQVLSMYQYGSPGTASGCFDETTQTYYISSLTGNGGFTRDLILFNIKSYTSISYTLNNFNSSINQIQLLAYNKQLFAVEYIFQERLNLYSLDVGNGSGGNSKLLISLPFQDILFSALFTQPTKDGYTILITSSSYTIYNLDEHVHSTLYDTNPIPPFSFAVATN